MVLMMGLEPIRYFYPEVLSLLCLPIPSHEHLMTNLLFWRNKYDSNIQECYLDSFLNYCLTIRLLFHFIWYSHPDLNWNAIKPWILSPLCLPIPSWEHLYIFLWWSRLDLNQQCLRARFTVWWGYQFSYYSNFKFKQWRSW